MRSLLVVFASCLVLGGAGARAETTYEVLEGTLTSAETGATQVLMGAFDAVPLASGRIATPGLTPLRVDDFVIQAGDLRFTPGAAVELEALAPVRFLELADQIHLRGDDVGLIQMRSGGELVAASDDEVTFRFLDFRSGPAGGGHAVGQRADGVAPRRLELEGTLYEVDQTFYIGRGRCGLPRIPLTPPGGVVISIGEGSDVVLEYDGLEVRPRETAEFVQPDAAGGVITRVSDGGDVVLDADSFRIHLEQTAEFALPGAAGEVITPVKGGVGGRIEWRSSRFRVDLGDFMIEPDSVEIHPEEAAEFVQLDAARGGITRVTSGDRSIRGELRGGGQVHLFDPWVRESWPVIGSATPTLEELGITAPDGAIVSYDGVTGELAVTSRGDLFVEGTAIDLPGLTSVTLSTPGGITVSGNLRLPSDVVLRLDAGLALLVEGEIEAPGRLVVRPPYSAPVSSCQGLWPIVPAQERAVGSFSLVASAARQIDIDVQPRRSHNRVVPGSRQWIPVAILGSEDLDVRDIDEASLRLGPDQAEPTSRRGRRSPWRGDVDRDRHMDLVARFAVRDIGIAYGDTEVCLVAETTAGETLEGCDAIQTLPDWLRSALHRRPPGTRAP